uniref:C-C motif chemokine n=1 Tax=Poecilia latipinna TaxID=48699 RepID=A0A3B3V281_9TELE
FSFLFVTVLVVSLLSYLCLTHLLSFLAAYIFCCRRYIPWKIPFSEIKGFSLQKSTELCPITAIIFHTKTGKRCADPTLKWVMDYVKSSVCGVHKKS